MKTLHDLSAAVKGRRKELGWTQAQLATRAGVSRPWVYGFERGKETVELQAVLRILEALDLVVTVGTPLRETPTSTVDLDRLLTDYADE